MSSRPRTRVAVIGAGAMGQNHARVYRELPDANLVAIADPNAGVSRHVADYYGVSGYTDHGEMIGKERPEAVTVAVPTQFHHRVALDALLAGCHVLVEKPIARTIHEAQDLVATARSVGRVLMVGHIERYNPAVLELKRRLDANEAGRVFQLHARRLGPFPARVRDVGVVVDLATHDLDVIRFLVGVRPVRVFAETRRNVHSSDEDLVTGLVVFEGGAIGLLEINWLTPTKIRELYVTGERGMFVANYLTQDLYFYENADANGHAWNQLAVLRGVSEGVMIRHVVRKKEPLRAELESFVAAVQGRPAGIVTGEDGMDALALALALVRSGREHEVVTDLEARSNGVHPQPLPGRPDGYTGRSSTLFEAWGTG